MRYYNRQALEGIQNDPESWADNFSMSTTEVDLIRNLATQCLGKMTAHNWGDRACYCKTCRCKTKGQCTKCACCGTPSS